MLYSWGCQKYLYLTGIPQASFNSLKQYSFFLFLLQFWWRSSQTPENLSINTDRKSQRFENFIQLRTFEAGPSKMNVYNCWGLDKIAREVRKSSKNWLPCAFDCKYVSVAPAEKGQGSKGRGSCLSCGFQKKFTFIELQSIYNVVLAYIIFEKGF